MGYSTVSIKAGQWYMIAAQFKTVGEATHVVKLNDFVKGTMVGTQSSQTAPRIQVWDPENGYTDYFFFSQSAGTPSKRKYNYWAPYNNSLDNYEIGQAATVDLGSGAWFNSANDCEITVAGEVVEVATKDIFVKGNAWNLIANPFPTTMSVNNSVNWKELAEAGKLVGTQSSQTAPRMQVWDAENGYTDYFFFSQSAGTPSKRKYNYWAPYNNSLDNYEIGQTATIPVTRGFWLNYAGEDMTLTFTK